MNKPTKYFAHSEKLELSDDNDVLAVAKYELVSADHFIPIVEETTEEGTRVRISFYPCDYEKILSYRPDKNRITADQFFGPVQHWKQILTESLSSPVIATTLYSGWAGRKPDGWAFDMYRLVTNRVLIIVEKRKLESNPLELIVYPQDEDGFNRNFNYGSPILLDDFRAVFDEVWSALEQKGEKS